MKKTENEDDIEIIQEKSAMEEKNTLSPAREKVKNNINVKFLQ